MTIICEDLARALATSAAPDPAAIRRLGELLDGLQPRSPADPFAATWTALTALHEQLSLACDEGGESPAPALRELRRIGQDLQRFLR